ncbi:hypothetical protein [Thermogemmatispora tikiterensis]|uniref:Uncharacterized protein n=1 Tax=Thermogemmatispora tikiterensis TaxID=1825093 RepID=A0A328VDG6_9CHLR|nr:hypothetical protein [Thermogemmatispora tikiterensis]RAQ94012.1 hypothetical protein A4R35_00610 [Thermogemmatispora tikiterensis]
MHSQHLTTYVAPVVLLEKREQRASPLAWYVVPLLILLGLAADIVLAVAIWCVIHGQSVVVTWHINWSGTVTIACK